MKKVFIIITGLLLIGVNVFAQGNLNVTGKLGVGTTNPSEKVEINGKVRLTGGGDTIISSGNPGNFRIQNTGGPGHASLALDNDIEGANVFFFKGGQNDHLSVVNGANYDYYHFENASSGENKVIRLYGFPSTASSNDYAYFQIVGTENDLKIQTNNLNGNIVLNPDSGAVGIGTSSPQGKLDVNGAIYQRGSSLHADYVFEPDYDLENIEEHSKYMWSNKHLKAIPKAKVDEEGQEVIEVGSHRRGIVEELEKAHIYIEQLSAQMNELTERLTKLETVGDNPK